VLEDLAGNHDRYLAMPNVGDTVDLTFFVPSRHAGADRTIFLHSRGYYRLHVAASGEPDTKTLREIENVPGAGARFAAHHFAQWQIAQQKYQ